MNWFPLRQYLRHVRMAMGRHDIHSPFVYDLIEHTLRTPGSNNLKERLEHRFPLAIWADVVDANDDWIRSLLGTTEPNDLVLILCGPHRTSTAQKRWNRVRVLPEVRLSLDLFDLGILLFSPDFRERQHFVLKRYGHSLKR